MRHPMLLILFCFFIIPVSISTAQDGCDIDLNDISFQLNEAQKAVDADNTLTAIGHLQTIQTEIDSILGVCALNDVLERTTLSDDGLSLMIPKGWAIQGSGDTLVFLATSQALLQVFQQGLPETLADGEAIIFVSVNRLAGDSFEDAASSVIGSVRRETTSLSEVTDETINGRRHLSFSGAASDTLQARFGIIDFSDANLPSYAQIVGIANNNTITAIEPLTDTIRESIQYPPIVLLQESGIPSDELSYSSSMNVREISSAFGNTLSPDGKWLAWSADQELCLYELATETEDCSAFPDSLGEFITLLQWSPDAQYIAFHEDFQRIPDADVWLFDVKEQTFANLTDDGDAKFTYVGVLETDTWIDNAITWGPDNLIYVLRTAIDAGATRDERTYEVLQIDPAIGTISTLQDLTGYFDFNPVLYRENYSLDGVMSVSPDASKMLIVVYEFGDDAETNGIWLIDLSGEEDPQLLATPEQFTTGYPVDFYENDSVRNIESIAWNADGTGFYVFAVSGRLSGFPMVYQMNLLQGDIIPLVDFSEYTREEFLAAGTQIAVSPSYLVPYAPITAPDRQNLIYANQGIASGGISLLVINGEYNDPTILYQGREMQRQADNTAFVAQDGTVLIYGFLLRPD